MMRQIWQSVHINGLDMMECRTLAMKIGVQPPPESRKPQGIPPRRTTVFLSLPSIVNCFSGNVWHSLN
jgi:hypothetical protein